MMKIAVAFYNSRISPVFDASKHVLVLDIEDRQIITSEVEHFPNDNPMQKAIHLSGLGVEELICGAVSTDLAQLLDTHGIKIIPFIAGDVGDVISAYLEKELPHPDFRMPGYSAMGKNKTKTI